MSRLVYSVLLAVTALAGGCNPYEPDLGDTPFRCEPVDPADMDKSRCPEGYDPVTLAGPPFCECQRSSGDRVDGGASADGSGSCNQDSNEPNESSGAATPTAIGIGANTAAFDNVSLCPQADIDVYSVNIVQPNTTLEVNVSFNPAIGVLGVRVLDSTSAMVTGGMGTMQGNILHAEPVLVTTGTYYVQVTSVSGQNNYSIQMTATQ
jgi:hypothetical protein